MDALLIRPARAGDLPELLEMQARSLRRLGAGFYPPALIEAALAAIGTMEPELIAEGTYHVATEAGRILGGAGWTRRAPRYGRLLDEAPTPLPRRHGRVGLVRSVYVAPEAARRGIARRLMEEVEAEMRQTAGIRTAELMASLAGEPLYRSLGYLAFSTHWLRLPDGQEMELRRMARALSAQEGMALPLAA